MSHPVKKVLSELNDINFEKNNLIINKGYFNKNSIMNMEFPKKISFAYLDFDFYEPTFDVLYTINDKIVLNGIILVDDYDFFSTGVKTAVDKWIDENNDSYSIKKIKTSLASFAIIKKIK